MVEGASERKIAFVRAEDSAERAAEQGAPAAKSGKYKGRNKKDKDSNMGEEMPVPDEKEDEELNTKNSVFPLDHQHDI